MEVSPGGGGAPGSGKETYTVLGQAGESGAENENEQNKGCAGCLRKGCLSLLIVVFVIILLLLFWPVKKPKGPETARPSHKLPKLKIGSGRIGNAHYSNIAGRVTEDLGDSGRSSSKGVFVVLTFKVKNLSNSSQGFDVFNVALLDSGGRDYPVDIQTSAKYAEDRGKIFSYPRRIGPKRAITVEAVFQVEKAARGFALVGRDFDSRYDETITMVIPEKNISVEGGKAVKNSR